MNNICEYKEEMEECKIGFQQSTVMEISAEFDRLKQENEMLKVDKFELIKENDQLRNDIEVLHNKINKKYQEQYEESMQSEDLRYVDEYAKGFAMAEELGYKIV